MNYVSANCYDSAASLKEIQIQGINKIYSCLIILAPILNQYRVLPLTYLEIITIFGVVFLLIKRQRIITLDEYAGFCIAGFVTSVIAIGVNYFSLSGFDTGLGPIAIRLVKYVMQFFGLVIAGRVFFDTSYAKKIYSIIVTAVVLALFVQYLLLLISGRSLYLIIPNVQLNYNEGVNSSELISSEIAKVSSGYFFRPSSFFLEPAYFSLFVVPWLVLELFLEEKPKYIKVILTSAAVLLTTSSLGLMGILIVWCIYAGYYVKLVRKDYKRLILLPLAIILVFIVGNYIVSDVGFTTSVNIKLNAAKQLNVASSLTVRLFRGALFYKEIGTMQKIFGVGYGNLSKYYDAVRMFLIYDSSVNEKAYMSGIFVILNSFGMIGLGLYIRWILSVWRKHDLCTRVMLVILVAFLFTSSCFETASYWIMVFFLLNMKSNIMGT